MSEWVQPDLGAEFGKVGLDLRQWKGHETALRDAIAALKLRGLVQLTGDSTTGPVAGKLCLRGARLDNLTFPDGTSIFKNVDLSGAYLIGTGLPYADLSGADLSTAMIMNDGFGHKPDLRTADLRGAHLAGATFSGVQLEGAHLEGAEIQVKRGWGRSQLRPVEFNSCHMQGTVFDSAEQMRAARINHPIGNPVIDAGGLGL